MIVALCEIKGIESAGYVVYFTATFPYVWFGGVRYLAKQLRQLYCV